MLPLLLLLLMGLLPLALALALPPPPPQRQPQPHSSMTCVSHVPYSLSGGGPFHPRLAGAASLLTLCPQHVQLPTLPEPDSSSHCSCPQTVDQSTKEWLATMVAGPASAEVAAASPTTALAKQGSELR